MLILAFTESGWRCGLILLHAGAKVDSDLIRQSHDGVMECHERCCSRGVIGPNNVAAFHAPPRGPRWGRAVKRWGSENMFDYSVAVGSILILIYRDIRELCDGNRQLMDSATRSTSTVRAYSECLPARSPSGVELGSCSSMKEITGMVRVTVPRRWPRGWRGRKYRMFFLLPLHVWSGPQLVDPCGSTEEPKPQTNKPSQGCMHRS